MTISRIFPNSLRAVLVAAALGGTALVAAAPAQAASPSFSMQFGGGGYFPHQQPHPGGNFYFRFGDRDHFRLCLTDNQIRWQLRDQGYRDVRFVREDYKSDKVWAVAIKHGRWVQFRVDRCTGRVDHLRYIKRSSNGSFNLSFTF